MNKKYAISVSKRPARARSERLRAAGYGSTGSITINSGTYVPTKTPGGTTQVVDPNSHTHANKKTLDAISGGDDGYLMVTRSEQTKDAVTGDITKTTVTEKVKAGEADHAASADNAKTADHANEAAALTADSPTRADFVSATHADEAAGHIAFKSGVSVEGGAVLDAVTVTGGADLRDRTTFGTRVFSSGMEGAGAAIWENAEGRLCMELDRLTVRQKASFRELELQELSHVGGAVLISPASARLNRVIPVVDENRNVLRWYCYYSRTDSAGLSVDCDFRPGDLIRCETYNREGGNRFYWRLVTQTLASDNGRDWLLVVSNAAGQYAEGSDTPEVGDTIVVLGNSTDKERQSAIILAAFGSGSPYIRQYEGISNFRLDDSRLVTKIAPDGNVFTGNFRVRTDRVDTPLDDYIRRHTKVGIYSIEPQTHIVLGDLKAATCTPAAVAVDIYRTAADGTRTKVTPANLRHVQGYTVCGKLLTSAGRLLVAPGEDSEDKDLVLRYTVENKMVLLGEVVEERIYTGPIAMTTAMDVVTLRLYRGTECLAETQVRVTGDAAAVRTEYKADIEATEQKFTSQYTKITEDVAGQIEAVSSKIEQTADQITAKVGAAGIDIEEGKITLTGTTEFKMLDGSTVGMFDANGHLKARFIDASTLRVNEIWAIDPLTGKLAGTYNVHGRGELIQYNKATGLPSFSIDNGLLTCYRANGTVAWTLGSESTELGGDSSSNVWTPTVWLPTSANGSGAGVTGGTDVRMATMPDKSKAITLYRYSSVNNSTHNGFLSTMSGDVNYTHGYTGYITAPSVAMKNIDTNTAKRTIYHYVAGVLTDTIEITVN